MLRFEYSFSQQENINDFRRFDPSTTGNESLSHAAHQQM
jgi:hypothetical protein